MFPTSPDRLRPAERRTAETVKGIPQKPLDGVSFKAALADPAADTGKQTQFYTMLGTRGIWHKGWFANTIHAATPAGWGHFDADRWELFNIEADRSQCHDLAGEHPDKLEELKALWFSEAAKYNGLPLSDLNIFETLTRTRPYLASERDSYVYYPDCAGVPPAPRPRFAAARSRCWLTSLSTAPAPKACCSSTAAPMAVTCCSSRTVGCISSTTSSVSVSRRFPRRPQYRWGGICSASAMPAPAPWKTATRRSAMSRCSSTTRRSAR